MTEIGREEERRKEKERKEEERKQKKWKKMNSSKFVFFMETMKLEKRKDF